MSIRSYHQVDSLFELFPYVLVLIGFGIALWYQFKPSGYAKWLLMPLSPSEYSQALLDTPSREKFLELYDMVENQVGSQNIKNGHIEWINQKILEGYSVKDDLEIPKY